MLILQQDAELTQTYVSSAVTVSVAGVVTSSSPLLVNGQSRPSGYTVVQGDQVSISLAASPSYSSHTFGTFTLDQTYTFCIVTKQNPNKIVDPLFYTEPPLAHTDPGWKPLILGKLVKFGPTFTKTTYTLDRSASLTGPTATDSYVFVCDYFDHCVYRTNLIGDTLQRIVTPNPYAIAYGHDNFGRAVPYITNTGLGQVTRLSTSDFTPDLTIPVQSGPRHIITDVDYNLWVANYSSNSVTRIQVDLGSQTPTTTHVPVGSGPLYLCSTLSHIYVSNSQDNTVTRIDRSDLTTSTFSSGGTSPWFIQVYGSRLYCANTSSLSMSVIDLNTLTILYTFNTGLISSFFIKDQVIYLVDQEQSILYTVELDGTAINQYALEETGIQLFVDQNVWVSCNYPNMPSRLVARDLDPTNSPIFSPIANADQSVPTTSNVINIDGVSQALVCSISGNAQFIKNDIPVGTSTTVTNGDNLAVSMNSASSSYTRVSCIVAVGHVVQEYHVTTAYAYVTPLPISWTSVFNAELDTDYNSSTETISGINQTLNAVAANSQLIKNGQPYTNTTIILNDSVQARVRSALDYWTTVIGIVDFGNLDLPYVVQTKGQPSLRLMDQSSRDLLPTEFLSPYLGAQDQTLLSVNLTDYTNTSHSLTVPVTPDSAEYNNDLDYLLLIDHLGNRVLRVNQDLVCVQEISVTSPYASCMGPGLSDSITEIPFAFITSSTTNSVLVFSRTSWTLVHTISVGTKPLGITGLTGTYRFAVCCYDQDVVQIWNYGVPTSSSLHHTITLPVGSKPVKVISDPTNTYLWIILASDKLVRYTISNNQVSTFDTDLAPWDLVATDTRVFVACAYSNTVQMFDQNGQLLQTLVVPGSIPSGLSYYEYQDKKYLAVCYYDSSVSSVDWYDVSTGTLVFDRSLISNERLVFGSALLDNKLVVFKQYQDAPDRAVLPIQHPDITVQNLQDVGFNAVVSSDVFTVTGLTRSNSPLSIPSLYGAVIYKNNLPVGTSTTVSNGDQFFIRFTTGNTYYRYAIPIIFNGHIYDWTVQTQPDQSFDSIVFVPKSGLEPDTLTYSNIVQLTGVTLGLAFPASVPIGTGILHNGIDITNTNDEPTEFMVQALDTVQLYATAKLPYSTISSHSLVLPNQTVVWTVSTMNLRVYRYPYFRQHWYNTDFDHRDFDPKASTLLDPYTNVNQTHVVGTFYDLDTVTVHSSAVDYMTVSKTVCYQSFTYTQLEYNTVLFVDPTYDKPQYMSLQSSTPSPDKYKARSFLINVGYDLLSQTLSLTPTLFVSTHKHLFSTEVSYSAITIADLILNSVTYDQMASYVLALYSQSYLNSPKYKQITYNHQYQQYAIEATTREFAQYGRNATYDVLYDGHIYVKNYLYHQILYGQTFDQYFHDFILSGTDYSLYHTYFTVYEHKYHQDPAFYWPIQLSPIIFQQTTRYIDVGYVKDFHTSELNSTDYDQYVHVKHNYLMPSPRHQEARTLSHYNMPGPNFRPSSKKPTTLMPSGQIVAHVRRPTHTVRQGLIINLHREFSNLPVPVPLSELWYDNTDLYDCLDKSYYTSQALAESAAVGAGILIEHVLTLEIVPGCWVWAHKILVNPEECSNLSGLRVKGWIRGG